MADFFPDLLERFSGDAFLKGVCRKYHYGKGQEAELRAVAEEMLPLMQREAFWESRESGSFNGKQKETAGAAYEDVIMSLGSSVDSLQESYHEKEQLSESYMLEALASELLLMGYGAYNRYVREKRNWHVARYHFPGGEENFPLEMMPELLKGFQYQITCNTAFCIIPKKSVVFVAELTQDEQVQCESICAGCHNMHCPNRVKRDLSRERMLARVADMPLSYGYSRIFGKL
ncbi:MAG: hypothetical protein K2O16_11040 [Lachnospiraceae bacterium]|nr:hypothetical protein [Lachnospiraceae bacterium]